MRKFLSLLLALVLILSLIPMTVVQATESTTVSAPTTFPDGTTGLTTTSITDGSFTTNSAKEGVFVTDFTNATKSIFDNDNTVTIEQCEGFMFKLTESGTANPQWYFIFEYYDQSTDTTSTQTFKCQSSTYHYWNGTAWGTGKAQSTSFEVGADGSFYVYFPFDNLNAAATLTGAVLSNIKLYIASATRNGTFSDWSFVQTAEQEAAYPLEKEVVEEEVVINAPTTFDGGEAILKQAITDGSVFKDDDSVTLDTFSSDLANSTFSIFDDKVVDIAAYKGVLCKVTSTGTASLYFRLKAQIGEDEIDLPANERTFYTYDGETWTSHTAAASNAQLPTEDCYLFYPFTDDDFTALATYGGTFIEDIKLYSSDGTNRTGGFSEWTFVYTADQIISEAYFDIESDLLFNVTASIPDGCTDGKLSFTFDGNTVEQTDEDGLYNLTGILPQQASTEITATWTGTVDGTTYTDTVTTTLADYCKALIEEASGAAELAKALLHYAAAAQAFKGIETLCNVGIEAVTDQVDLAAIPSTYTNNDKDAWTKATLRLEDAIVLKIKVDAPESVTEVTAQVDGRGPAEILDIVDGYVSIEIYAYELSSAITFSYGDAEKTLVISADLVLKNTTNEAYQALAQAIANYANEAYNYMYAA